MMDLLIAIASLVLHIACICMHASKDSSCSHLWRTWNRLKLWINALLVFKAKSSDQLNMILMNVLQSYCQGCVLFLPNDTWTHYVTCWCQCWCCLSTVMVVRMLFSCPKQTYELGCTCGQVSMVVTMVCIIRAPRWCNDKGGSWLSLIFSSISIYCLYHHEHHHTVIVAARCNLAIHRAFPATRSAVIHLSGSVSAPFLSFPPL